MSAQLSCNIHRGDAKKKTKKQQFHATQAKLHRAVEKRHEL